MPRLHRNRRGARELAWRTLGVAAGVFAFLIVAASAHAAESGGIEGWRRLALALVNDARQAHGRSPLALGPALNEAAQAHAEDMLRRRYYSHTSPEGDDVQDRYVAAGGSRWRLVEENIARCAGCRPPITLETIKQLQEGWMNSPHHRENILREGLNKFGYGIVVDAEQGLYAVQTFAGPGTPRSASEDDAAKTLSDDEVAMQAARLINRVREKAGLRDLDISPALTQAARNLLPDPASEDVSLKPEGNLFEAVPAEARGRWRALSVVAGACGGCGTEPTDADLRFFRQQWLENPQYRARLLDPDLTSVGFTLQANGAGRKVAALVLGTAR